MIENLLLRLQSSFDTSIKYDRDRSREDDEYGNPAARGLYTQAWISNHSELFHTIKDRELIAETKSIKQQFILPDVMIDSTTRKLATSEAKIDLARNTKKLDNLKKEAKTKEEVDSGLPYTTTQTHSTQKPIPKPTCDSCQSLLRSLCNGCYHKFQNQTQCYFFSTFKKNKSKKLKETDHLCGKCKAIMESEHTRQSDDLPAWSRQRKGLLYKQKKNMSGKPGQTRLCKHVKLDRATTKNKKKAGRSRTRNSHNTPSFHQTSKDFVKKRFGKDHSHCRKNAFDKLRKNASKQKKKTETCVTACNVGVPSHTAVLKNKQSERDVEEHSTTPKGTPRDKCQSSGAQGRLSWLKKLCPCDAACEFCEELKNNWRLLTTLPKNWGTLGQNKAAC